ncbi:MAG TPA: hypothetical protein VMF58_12290 [Rhizomicrobium sp.]|nr:hypothetical protein [Rhizomicrobium sp.]
MLTIGTTREGSPIRLTDKERARHIHVVGSIGTGKSKLLEYMIQQDIAVGRGLCLIDPHGTLVESLERWCALRGMGILRRIHIIRPGGTDVVPGFNPLRTVPGQALSVRVDAMVAACAQAWGVADMSDTPRLEKILRSTFFALSARGLTLAEGPALLRAADPDGVRRNLTTDLPDPVFQIAWDELNSLSRKDFAEHVESTHTRLSKFLMAPAMRLMVGQREHTLHFREAMDRGDIVLIDLGAREAFSYENARVLGTLLINDLFLSALGRDERISQRRPFTLYVDEAYDFLSGDIERILDQTRKFGLHAVLAHQRIGQLKKRGEGIYNAVMGGTQTKIVLGGLSDDDAGIMAREIMRGDIDLTTPKPGITMPVVVDEVPFWLESESTSEGNARSTSLSEGRATGASSITSQGESTSYMAPNGNWSQPNMLAMNMGSGAASNSSRSVVTTEGVSTTFSRTYGRSQTLKSVREERPTQFYTLEESLHLAALNVRNLPDQTAIVKRRGMRTVVVDTVEVKPVLNVPKIVERFRHKTYRQSPYVSSPEAVSMELEGRRAQLFGPQTEPIRAEDFWTSE